MRIDEIVKEDCFLDAKQELHQSKASFNIKPNNVDITINFVDMRLVLYVAYYLKIKSFIWNFLNYNKDQLKRQQTSSFLHKSFNTVS